MIDEIVEECSKILADKRVVSEWEVERALRRAAFRVLGAEVIGKKLDEVLRNVKRSFLEEPLSVKSLHYSESFEINGERFYHLHTCKPTREEIGVAYDEMVKSRRYVKALKGVGEILRKFFEGYSFKSGLIHEFSGERSYAVSVFLIGDVSEDLEFHRKLAESYDGEYVVVALTERDILPFLDFFKKHSEEVKKAGFYIWVADEERGYVDPFIGYPKDVKLWKKFRNPKAASMINSLWRIKVEEID